MPLHGKPALLAATLAFAACAAPPRARAPAQKMPSAFPLAALEQKIERALRQSRPDTTPRPGSDTPGRGEGLRVIVEAGAHVLCFHRPDPETGERTGFRDITGSAFSIEFDGANQYLRAPGVLSRPAPYDECRLMPADAIYGVHPSVPDEKFLSNARPSDEALISFTCRDGTDVVARTEGGVKAVVLHPARDATLRHAFLLISENGAASKVFFEPGRTTCSFEVATPGPPAG